MEFTDKQLVELIRIVKENQNVNARWVALSKDPINDELKLSKDDFLKRHGLRSRSVEGRIREHIENNQTTNLNKLRDELKPSNDTNYFPALSLSNAQSDASYYTAGVTITLILLALSVVLGMWFLNPGQNKEPELDVAQGNVRNAVDLCMESSDFERSCRTDPELTYCSIAFENQIGSGCTSRIRAVGGAVEQTDFCIEQVMPIVRRQCMIDTFGCAAVTGSVNC